MTTHEATRLSRAFCSARDRKIPVLVRDGPDLSRGDAGPELVGCLDYGVRCTGWLCPLFPVPTLPAEELLEEAIQAERSRQAQSVAEGRAILERALREGREWREKESRRTSGRRRGRASPAVPSERPSST